MKTWLLAIASKRIAVFLNRPGYSSLPPNCVEGFTMIDCRSPTSRTPWTPPVASTTRACSIRSSCAARYRIGLLPRKRLECRLLFLDERISPSHEFPIRRDRRLDGEAFAFCIHGNSDRVPDLETEFLERFLRDCDCR